MAKFLTRVQIARENSLRDKSQSDFGSHVSEETCDGNIQYKQTKEQTENSSTLSINTKVTDQETMRRLHVCFKSRPVSSLKTKTVVLLLFNARLMAHP